jgi:hypothetical protein
VSLKSKIAATVKSLTSEQANEDTPAGVDPPDPDGGPVEMPDREPMVGFEPEPEPGGKPG